MFMIVPSLLLVLVVVLTFLTDQLWPEALSWAIEAKGERTLKQIGSATFSLSMLQAKSRTATHRSGGIESHRRCNQCQRQMSQENRRIE